MVFGTFDGIHEGHRDFLRQAKQQGDHLIVVVSRDSTIAKVYGRTPKRDEIARLSDLLAENIAQDIVMGHERENYRVLKEHQPDIVVLGFTQKKFVDSLHKKALELGLDHMDIVFAAPHNPTEFPPSEFTDEEIYIR